MNELEEIHRLKRSLRDLLKAIDKAQNVGCIKYLDCWDDADELWYDPIDTAREVSK